MRRNNRKASDIKRNFDYDISNLVKIKSIKEFRTSLAKKLKNPIFQSSLLFSKNKFLSSGFGGSSTRTFQESNLQHLLIMTLLKLKREIVLLNKYIDYKNQYEMDILNGNYESALDNIEKVRNCVGLSFWYLEAKLSTLSLLGDVDAFVNFYNSISNAKINEIESRDLDLIFDRTSPTTKNDRITYTLDSLKDGLSVGDALDSYIIDFMHRFNCGEKYNPYKVMSYFWQCNIIDIYNTTLKLLFTESIDLISLDESIKEDINYLANNLDDIKLKNFVGLPCGEVLEIEKEYITVCDLYISGNYEECKNHYELNFISKKNIFSLYEFYINSIVDTNRIWFSDRIDDGIFKIIIESSLDYKNRDRLQKLYYLLNHIDVLQVHCLRDEKRIVNFDRDNIESIYRYFEYTSFPINPFNPSLCLEHSVSSKMTRAKIDDLIEYPIPMYRNKKRIADYHFHEQSFSKAIDIYLSIIDAPEHMVDEINNKIILCYFHNEQVLKACKFICDLHFKGELNIGRVDCKKVLEVLENCEPPDITTVEIPIAVYLLASQVNEEQIASLYLDDYLDYVELTRPSELEPKDEMHVFLMHKVCSLNVLESLHTVRNIYSSSSERLLDRMLILSKLNDEKNEEIIRETKFLTTQYSRNLCVKDIGKGKININFDVLSEIIKDEKSHYVKGMIKAYEEGKDSFDFSYDEIKNQKNTAIYGSVYEFLCAVRDVYTLDGKYGLDYQLNTKIRHNGIVPALRSVFDSEGILCKNSNNKYHDNELFERECKPLLWESAYNDYQDKIKNLSHNIDTRLFKLKTVYMQIMTNDKTDEERLFKFPITEKDITNYIMYLDSERTIDDYVKHALGLLKIKTQDCLKVGRVLLSKALYQKFLEDLRELKSTLKFNGVNKYKSSLSLVINDLEMKMKDISEWLDFSEVVGENFKLDVAVYEAENFVKSIFPNVNLNITLEDNPDLILNGKLLDSFVHMFILLFENASKKRRYPDKLEIDVSVRSIDEDNIKISITNEYSEVEQAVIEKINSEINTPEYLYNANKEKSSGLFKVKKILEIDFQSKNEVYLSCDNGKFTFNANLNISSLRV
ncbi:hypothetical protein JS87_06150 [Vibrio vulnificus]|uniref:hypothetical protein n=2 Tax=Vibrio TaxID=662 RepID=UPI00050534DA|nr:hypothetical protein [Vibrio vulnificus]KFK51796.1 hypothetical protein JS87_06150 [Vibrio vulnificus]